MTAISDQQCEECVRALASRDFYPERPAEEVEHIETHISHVFLTDRFAYKLKKPVRYDFLDFSTREARRRACQQELTLNRRLAPDVYLEVTPLTADRRGKLSLGGGGEPVDWVVKMRRLPRQRALDRLIATGALTAPDIDRIAKHLIRFYAQQAPVSLTAEQYRTTVESHVRGNLEELLRDVDGDSDASILVQRTHAAQLRFLKTSPELLEARVCDGRIVEGHGDLRPEHIYLAPGPIVIDCIEFNAEFRQLDVADELAFLDMECALLGADEAGARIIEQYRQQRDDNVSSELLEFYRSYRACVRAKVHAIRAGQLPDEERADPLEAAERYLQLAARYSARMGAPLLLVVRGLMGVGKSTLAASLADALALKHLQTDAVRRELLGEPDSVEEFGQGRYQPAQRKRVYEEMFRRAGEYLAHGLSVVLDGTFLTTESRAAALQIAQQHGAMPLILHCRCSDKLALERLAERQAAGGSISDGRPEMFQQQKQHEQADPPGAPAATVDTSAGERVMLQTLFERLKKG